MVSKFQNIFVEGGQILFVILSEKKKKPICFAIANDIMDLMMMSNNFKVLCAYQKIKNKNNFKVLCKLHTEKACHYFS